MKAISDKRRAKLAAMGIKYPTSTFTPTAPKLAVVRQAGRPRDTGPDTEMVDRIWARDRGRCGCCAAEIFGRRGIEWCIAHRKLRAHGVDNRASNLYLSCGSALWGCERDTHDRPERSYAAGRMVSFADNPEDIEMEHAVLGRVLLDNDFGYTRCAGKEPDEQPF